MSPGAHRPHEQIAARVGFCPPSHVQHVGAQSSETEQLPPAGVLPVSRTGLAGHALSDSWIAMSMPESSTQIGGGPASSHVKPGPPTGGPWARLSFWLLLHAAARSRRISRPQTLA